VERLFSSLFDFGPNRLDPEGAAVQQVFGKRAGCLRRAVREIGPCKPGVYGMLDEHGALIYVGKAKQLRARLLSYFRARSRDPKAGRILRHARSIVWEVSPCEFGALHRELELIRRWRPRFNVQGQPHGRQFIFVCLGRGAAPYAFLTRRPGRTALACFGPIPGGLRAAEGVRRVNDCFQLRDCPQAQDMIFADQAHLFPVQAGAGCLRYEIGTCLGPCLAACSQRGYAARVRQARAFLEGADQKPLHALEQQMQTAAAAEQFERAAALRDRFTALHWLSEQLAATRRAQTDGAFVYPVKTHDGSSIWYLIRGGRTLEVLREPGCPRTRRLAAKRLQEVYRRGVPGEESLSFAHCAGVLLIAAWFRRHPGERARARKPADVIRHLRRDGKD
jgi:excinuclease ABC subunit C